MAKVFIEQKLMSLSISNLPCLAFCLLDGLSRTLGSYPTLGKPGPHTNILVFLFAWLFFRPKFLGHLKNRK